MKKFLSLLFLSLFIFSLAAAKVLHVETEHFDIIFDEEAKESAGIIFNCAEDFLSELCQQYNTAPEFKTPVYITSKSDVHNGYFTNYNYNHILIYDALPDQELMVNSENIKKTFYHELTHLVSLNTRNKFWRTFDIIFGDIYNPGYYLNMTTFFNEGATVTQESMDGEGRLNNGFYLQALKQAKVSGKFPHWSDVMGARTVYPSGKASYLFGSAFTEYIQKKYGMDKYAQLWYKGINFHGFTMPWVFKNTYGISLDEEWNNFYQSIDTGDIVEAGTLVSADTEQETDNAAAAGRSEPQKKNTDAFIKTKPLHRYVIGGGTRADNGNFLLHDKTTGELFLCFSEKNGKIKKKKILTDSSLSEAGLCGGGKFISIKKTIANGSETKTAGQILNLSEKKCIKLKSSSIYALTAMTIASKNYAACIEQKGQRAGLCIYDLDSTKIPLYEFCFEENQIPFNLTSNENGDLWFILKDKMEFSICRLQYNPDEKKSTCRKIKLDGMFLRDLSVLTEAGGNTEIYFSYTRGRDFPKAGKIFINGYSAEITLNTASLSGGFFSPVPFGEKILYSANYYDETKIQSLDSAVLFESKNSTEKFSIELKDEFFSEQNNKPDEISLVQSNPYRKLFYPKQTIAPFSVLQSYYLAPSIFNSDEKDGIGGQTLYPFGLSMIKNNPSDTRHLILTAGYNPIENAGGAGGIFLGKTHSGFFDFNDTFNSIFDSKGLRQLNNETTASIKFQTGRISRITLSDTNFLYYGKSCMKPKQQTLFLLSDESLEHNYFYNRNTASISFSNIHPTGIKTHERLGFSAGINFKSVFVSADTEKENSIYRRFQDYKDGHLKFFSLYPSLSLVLPKILPIENKGYITYNLPVILNASIYSSNSTLAFFSLQTVLFSWEAQKGLGIIPLFLNSISLSALYQCEYVHDHMKSMGIKNIKEDFSTLSGMMKTEYAGASFAAKFAVNTGALASQSVNFNFIWNIHYGISGNNEGKIINTMSLGVNSTLF